MPATAGSSAGGARRRLASDLNVAERRILAVALNYPACGIYADALAADAGLAPEQAAPVVGGLVEAGFLTEAPFVEVYPDGHRNWSTGRFTEIRDAGIEPLPPPPPTVAEYHGPLPCWLRDSFWHHPDSASITLPDDAEYVAAHLLTSPSVGLRQQRWALDHLPLNVLVATRPYVDDLTVLRIEHAVTARRSHPTT